MRDRRRDTYFCVTCVREEGKGSHNDGTGSPKAQTDIKSNPDAQENSYHALGPHVFWVYLQLQGGIPFSNLGVQGTDTAAVRAENQQQQPRR